MKFNTIKISQKHIKTKMTRLFDYKQLFVCSIQTGLYIKEYELEFFDLADNL